MSDSVRFRYDLGEFPTCLSQALTAAKELDLDRAGARPSGGKGNWISGPFIVFDTETTGINVDKDRIVTAAMVAWEDGQLAQRQWLANPGIPIPPAAQAVHQITDEIAQTQGAPLEQVLVEVREQLVAAIKAGYTVVVYKADYDLPLLENNLREFGLETLAEQVGDFPVLDPMLIDRHYDRYRKGKRRLSDLSQHYRTSQVDVDLHNALVDCHLTLQVLWGVLRSFPDIGELDVTQLRAAQSQWHYDWAKSFNDFLVRKGRKPDVSLSWV